MASARIQAAPTPDRHAGLDPGFVQVIRESEDPDIREHADEILGVIGRFYGWQPARRPPLPDLEARARAAICWRPWHVQGSERGILSRGLPSPPDRRFTEPYFRPIHGVRLFRREDEDRRRTLIRTRIGDSLWASLDSPGWNQYRHRIWQPFWDSLGILAFASFGAPQEDSLRADWWSAFAESILHTGISILVDRWWASASGPLLDLWLAGNSPLGFDKDDNLVVLVA